MLDSEIDLRHLVLFFYLVIESISLDPPYPDFKPRITKFHSLLSINRDFIYFLVENNCSFWSFP